MPQFPIVKNEAIHGAERQLSWFMCAYLEPGLIQMTGSKYFLVHMCTHCYCTVKLIPWVCITHDLMNISTFKIFNERDFTVHSFTVFALKETSKY